MGSTVDGKGTVWWLAAIAGLAAASAMSLAAPAGAASDVKVTAVDCVGHPRKIAIQNLGDTPQNLAGWKLISDQPKEVFELSVAGTISPVLPDGTNAVFVFNGHGGLKDPYFDGKSWTYPWNWTEFLEESAFFLHEDGKDFIRLVDASQFPWKVVSVMPCPGTTDIPPWQQPATPTPSPSSTEPDNQNPSQTDQTSSGETVSDQSGAAGQNVSGATTGQAGNTQTTAQSASVSGQAAGGPASGVGSLAAGSGGPFAAQSAAVALLSLAAGAVLAIAGALILRRSRRRP